MSAHRAGTRLATHDASDAVTPGGEPWGRVLASMSGHTELERLFGMILAFPTTAERLLTPRRVVDPVLLSTLRAEALLRLDRPRVAATYARQAASAAANAIDVQPTELLPAVIVLADASVLAGAPDAVEGCADALAVADQYGDTRRAAIAAGLHAVAVFHQHSCRQAGYLLEQLGAGCHDPDTTAALTRAAATLDGCCAQRGQQHWPPASRPVTTAGGRTQPGIFASFLSDRLLRWRGCHDCGLTSSTWRQA